MGIPLWGIPRELRHVLGLRSGERIEDGQPITDRLAVADQAVLRRQHILDPE